jgi:hypothetical protein
MAVSYKKLVEGVKEHGAPAIAGLRSALVERAILPADLDLGKLFVECFGWHAFSACRENKQQATRVMETAGAVSADAFLNITQQFAYSAILQAYDIPERVFSKLIPSRPSKFKWERVPGVSHIGDEALVVDEGKEFPVAGVAEDWIDTPETRKRGMRIPITKEAIFFDQTGLVLERCRQAGDWLGVNKEKRAITCVVDAGESDLVQYRYKWRNTSYATYQTSTPWINSISGNALNDYATVQKAWQTLVQIPDPYTGEPQNVEIRHIVVPPALIAQVPYALRGMTKQITPGFATTGTPVSTEVPNPMGDIIGRVQTVSSQLLRNISGSDSHWWLGDLSAAFEYVENWPLQVLNLGAGSHDEFHRDIVAQFRADERGTFNTRQPRKIVLSTP